MQISGSEATRWLAGSGPQWVLATRDNYNIIIVTVNAKIY